MALDMELLLVLGLLVAIVLVLAYYRRTVRSLETLLGQKQTGAYKIGDHQARGDLAQLLGTFQILGEYEDLILLSTTSRQASLDLIGVKPDSIDFIEFKKKGATLQSGERRFKQLIDEKKVNYRILDVELPDTAMLRDRP